MPQKPVPPQKIMQSAKLTINNSTYYKLLGCKEGIFYRHHRETLFSIANLPKNQKEALVSTVKALLDKDSTVYSDTHKKPGIKRVGKSEKKFDGKYKVKFSGNVFGKLRIDTHEREATAGEKSVLGENATVVSPVAVKKK